MKKNALKVLSGSLLVFCLVAISCNKIDREAKEKTAHTQVNSKKETEAIKEFLTQHHDLLYYEESALLLASERASSDLVKKFSDNQLKEIVKNKEDLKFYTKKYNVEPLHYLDRTKSDLYQLSVASDKDFDKIFLKFYGDFHQRKNIELMRFDTIIDRVDLNGFNEKVKSKNYQMMTQVDSIFKAL